MLTVSRPGSGTQHDNKCDRCGMGLNNPRPRRRNTGRLLLCRDCQPYRSDYLKGTSWTR